MIRQKQESKEIIIDLTGPDGNAFALMAYAKNFGKQLKWSDTRIKDFLNEMMSGDYEHLLEVFDREFGSFVILER